MKTITSFRFLANDFQTDKEDKEEKIGKSPHSKNQASLSKVKSPKSTFKQRPRVEDLNDRSSKSRDKPKSPSPLSSPRSTLNTCVLDMSSSHLSQERPSTNTQSSYRNSKPSRDSGAYGI